jgi:hypothetical protein
MISDDLIINEEGDRSFTLAMVVDRRNEPVKIDTHNTQVPSVGSTELLQAQVSIRHYTGPGPVMSQQWSGQARMYHPA